MTIGDYCELKAPRWKLFLEGDPILVFSESNDIWVDGMVVGRDYEFVHVEYTVNAILHRKRVLEQSPDLKKWLAAPRKAIIEQRKRHLQSKIHANSASYWFFRIACDRAAHPQWITRAQ